MYPAGGWLAFDATVDVGDSRLETSLLVLLVVLDVVDALLGGRFTAGGEWVSTCSLLIGILVLEATLRGLE
jgi:hypothetical protein